MIDGLEALRSILNTDIVTLDELVANNAATASYYAGMKEYASNLLMATDQIHLTSSDLESDEAVPQYSNSLNQDQTPQDPQVSEDHSP
jgi:hypothetical protein